MTCIATLVLYKALIGHYACFYVLASVMGAGSYVLVKPHHE